VNVLSGGTAAFVKLFTLGTLNVSAGATTHDLTISSGGIANVSGLITSNATVAASGTLNVLAGGAAQFVDGFRWHHLRLPARRRDRPAGAGVQPIWQSRYTDHRPTGA
jgi:hypothetical protein